MSLKTRIETLERNMDAKDKEAMSWTVEELDHLIAAVEEQLIQKGGPEALGSRPRTVVQGPRPKKVNSWLRHLERVDKGEETEYRSPLREMLGVDR